jgi:hypothetical protein
VNLGDIGFWRANADDGHRDFFWQTRDSNMLIKGGSNYAYEQVRLWLSVASLRSCRHRRPLLLRTSATQTQTNKARAHAIGTWKRALIVLRACVCMRLCVCACVRVCVILSLRMPA